MTKVNIDAVSAEVKALINDMKLGESQAGQARSLAQPKLKLVWSALEAKQPVSGCQNKKEWCKFAGITPRYAQYILKDGSRKRTEKKDANPSVRVPTIIKVGDLIKVGSRRFKVKFAPEDETDLSKTQDGDYRITFLAEPVEQVTKPPHKKKVKRYSQKFTGNFVGMGKAHKTHKMQADGKRTWCGKRMGETLAADARMADNPTCRNCRNGENTDILRKTQPVPEKHTGQHLEHDEYCDECFKYQQEQERLQLKWNAAYEAWRKRIQTLINTWRNGRLSEESKYREEFEAAAVKFQKRLKREGLEHWKNMASKAGSLHDARGRMEGAIADRNRAYPSMKKKETITLAGWTQPDKKTWLHPDGWTIKYERHGKNTWRYGLYLDGGIFSYFNYRNGGLNAAMATALGNAEWLKEKRVKQELSEPAKALAATVDVVDAETALAREKHQKWEERRSAEIRNGTYHPFSACPGNGDEPGFERIDSKEESEEEEEVL